MARLRHFAIAGKVPAAKLTLDNLHRLRAEPLQERIVRFLGRVHSLMAERLHKRRVPDTLHRIEE